MRTVAASWNFSLSDKPVRQWELREGVLRAGLRPQKDETSRLVTVTL
jgi:hypothetical protein